MGGVCNGIALHGGLRPFCATFLVFSDYMKPAVRLAALMKLTVIYLFTHDSVFVGEVGPTHQPIEHLFCSPRNSWASRVQTRGRRGNGPRHGSTRWNGPTGRRRSRSRGRSCRFWPRRTAAGARIFQAGRVYVVVRTVREIQT
jgi:hypothetical protein